MYRRVLLPKWAVDEKSVLKYLERYPSYQLVRIEGNYAICADMSQQ